MFIPCHVTFFSFHWLNINYMFCHVYVQNELWQVQLTADCLYGPQCIAAARVYIYIFIIQILVKLIEFLKWQDIVVFLFHEFILKCVLWTSLNKGWTHIVAHSLWHSFVLKKNYGVGQLINYLLWIIGVLIKAHF